MRIKRRSLFERFCFCIARWSPYQLRYAVWMVTGPRCEECGRPYGREYGFPDLIIPNDFWKRISNSRDEDGLLCPSCIAFRLHRAGYRDVVSSFESGPLKSHRQESKP